MRQHQRYPRIKLHPDFKNAVYADSRNLIRLAPEAGYASYTRLSTLLNARTIPRTPINVERLQKLAALVGYAGEVFRG